MKLWQKRMISRTDLPLGLKLDLVGADRVVVLHPPAALDADVAGIVLPADPERDHPVRLGNPAQDLRLVILLLVGDEIEDVLGHFLHCLDEFVLMRVAPFDPFHELVEVDVVGNCHRSISPLRAKTQAGRRSYAYVVALHSPAKLRRMCSIGVDILRGGCGERY
jgi:hypothetical protein